MLHHSKGHGRLERHVYAVVLAELMPTLTVDDVPLTLRSTAGGSYIDALVCCSYALLVKVSLAAACVAIEALFAAGRAGTCMGVT